MDGIYRVKQDGGRPELVRGDVAEATVSFKRKVNFKTFHIYEYLKNLVKFKKFSKIKKI